MSMHRSAQKKDFEGNAKRQHLRVQPAEEQGRAQEFGQGTGHTNTSTWKAVMKPRMTRRPLNFLFFLAMT